MNESWPEQIGALKTNTALLYDEKLRNVEEWGYSALARKSRKKSKDQLPLRKKKMPGNVTILVQKLKNLTR